MFFKLLDSFSSVKLSAERESVMEEDAVMERAREEREWWRERQGRSVHPHVSVSTPYGASDRFDPLKGQRKKRMEVLIEWLFVRDPSTQYKLTSLSLYSSTVPLHFALTRSVSAVEVVM